jgi:excisionase family DNA binding protein
MALTLAQAAERLDLSPATLRSQIRNGRLRGKLVGKTWTVTEGELERYRRDSLGRRRSR